MNSEHIMVMDNGTVAEQGRFKDLNRYRDMKIDEEDEEEPITSNKVVGLEQVMVKGENTKEANSNDAVREDEEELAEKAKKKEEEELLEKYDGAIFGRLFAYASEHKCLFFLGILASIGNGLVFPIFSIFLSKMLASLVYFSTDPAKARTDANLYALLFFLIGLAAFFFNIIQQSVFSFIG